MRDVVVAQIVSALIQYMERDESRPHKCKCECGYNGKGFARRGR